MGETRETGEKFVSFNNNKPLTGLPVSPVSQILPAGLIEWLVGSKKA